MTVVRWIRRVLTQRRKDAGAQRFLKRNLSNEFRYSCEFKSSASLLLRVFALKFFKIMKRVFVAVDISHEARGRAAAYIEALRREFRAVRVGWDKPEKLHLTLKFLGDTEERQLSELGKIVAKISSEISKFKLQILNTGVFPAARNPRVLWLDVKDAAGNLAKINHRLESECEKIGCLREK